MARVEQTGNWTVGGSVEKVRETILGHMGAAKWRVQAAEGNGLAFKRGSQLATRLIGGWMLGPSKFPSRADVTVEDSGGQTIVNAAFGEAFGVGSVVGIKKKYGAYFDTCVADLGAALRA